MMKRKSPITVEASILDEVAAAMGLELSLRELGEEFIVWPKGYQEALRQRIAQSIIWLQNAGYVPSFEPGCYYDQEALEAAWARCEKKLEEDGRCKLD
jgi:hypothetical protein